MSENLTQPKPPESIDPALAAEWFAVADKLVTYGQQTIINRGNGPEEFILNDVVGKQIRDEAGNRIGSVPTVVLSREDGTTEDLGVADFLTFVGADSFGLRHMVDQAKVGANTNPELSDSNIEDTVERWGKAVYAGETAVHAAATIGTPDEDISYDYLFAPDAPVSSSDAQLEFIAPAEKDPRLEVLFAPKMTLDEFRSANPVAIESYDHLFMADSPERNKALAEQSLRSAQRKNEEAKYTNITDESRKNAAVQLSKSRMSDRVLDSTLRKFELDNPNITNLVDEIRTNADLRYALGNYFLTSKLPSKLHKMPNRILGNSEKSPNHNGYKGLHLTSREYASMLALAMIDGTFMGTPQGDEILTRPSDGSVIVGQHRAAAMELLK